MINNKIKIPWYKRTPKGINVENDMGDNPISFHIPDIPKPKPRTQPETARQPVRVPVTSPITSPVTSPVFQPDFKPFPFPNPIPNPLPFPNPFPNPIPVPERKPNNQPQGNPAPAPQLPAFPVMWNNPMFTDPNFDWAKHWEEVSKNLPKTTPAPEKKGGMSWWAKTPEEMFSNFITPIVGLFLLNEAKNKWIEVNITDPIYTRMLADPVLGPVLRESEKADLDAKKVGTILANFDWENGDYQDLEKQLAIGIGVAGAARLMVFILGRKVLFRI